MPDALIYGAGAIGSFMGYLLSEGTPDGGMVDDVGLLGRERHIKKIKESGLEVVLPDGAKSIRFRHCFSSLDEFSSSSFRPELVVVCIKTYSLPALCRELAASGLLDGRLSNAVFVLLMNGMGNRDAFASLSLPAPRLLEGITAMGVKFAGEGRVELKGKGRTAIEARLDEGMQKHLRQRLAEKGFEVDFPADYAVQQWNKLFVNAVINPITALTGQENGAILSPLLQGTARQIVREAVAVAVREGISADEAGVFDLVNSVAGKTAANTSSMLQDVLKGRMTEIDSINGYVVRLAGRHGLEAPVNEAMVALVKSMGQRKAQ